MALQPLDEFKCCATQMQYVNEMLGGMNESVVSKSVTLRNTTNVLECEHYLRHMLENMQRLHTTILQKSYEAEGVILEARRNEVEVLGKRCRDSEQ